MPAERAEADKKQDNFSKGMRAADSVRFSDFVAFSKVHCVVRFLRGCLQKQRGKGAKVRFSVQRDAKNLVAAWRICKSREDLFLGSREIMGPSSSGRSPSRVRKGASSSSAGGARRTEGAVDGAATQQETPSDMAPATPTAETPVAETPVEESNDSANAAQTDAAQPQ